MPRIALVDIGDGVLVRVLVLPRTVGVLVNVLVAVRMAVPDAVGVDVLMGVLMAMLVTTLHGCLLTRSYSRAWLR